MSSFEVIPAIDLVGGRVVRVEQGDLDRQTTYSDDPVATAHRWADEGAPRLHVVDLEGAVAGEPRHAGTVAEIVGTVDIPVQVAGAIRSLDVAKHYLEIGADRIVVGTRALTDEAFLADLVAAVGPRLVVAPDVAGREVRVAGWTRGSGEDVIDCARRLFLAGVERVLCTDTQVDGTMSGPNIQLLLEIVEASGQAVIASGGVANVEHVTALSRIPGVEGVVVGKALYEGAVRLPEALEAVA